MSKYLVTLNVGNTDFPELGVPGQPVKSSSVKTNKVNKADYQVYERECNTSLSHYKTQSVSSVARVEFSNSSFKANLELDTEVSKTYKFLGMDIRDDFNAVITIPSGQVVVGSLYDSQKLVLKDSSIQMSFRISRGISEGSLDYVLKIYKSLKESDVRRIVTALKTGVAYDLTKRGSAPNSMDKDFTEVVSKLMGYLNIDEVKSSLGVFTSEFTSILLSMVKKQQKLQRSVVSTSSTLSDEQVAECIYSMLILYWESLVSKYNTLYSTLCCLDLWSDCQKKIYGDKEYSSRMSRCITMVNVEDSSSQTYNMLSFSGISAYGSMVDQNITRSRAYDTLKSLNDSRLFTRYSTSPERLNSDMTDFLLGCIDDTGIEHASFLSAEELQALSVLDSLSYIDEDASLIKDTYDMSDPDERGLYVKSVIKSYERNFKDFKPAQNYDVTDTLATMVENGDTVASPTVFYDDGTEDSLDDIYTSTEDEIKLDSFKKDLKKVLILLDKTLKRVFKGL